ncbi:MAG: hypothetical protein HS108_13325 [Planctomycetes bacterium]|jgi:hypothetical protein|nr:hypothetical protein [Planctomycetota bacterium]
MYRVYQASSPQVEVDGRTVMAVVNGMLVRALARELLEAEGIVDVQPRSWLSQQAWLNVYRAIQENLGADTLYAIGRRIPYSAEFPDEQMQDVPSALAAIDVAYHMAHRGGEIGVYKYVEAGPDHYQIQCDNPYPNVFNLGIVTSLVERFRGRMQFAVRMLPQGKGTLWDNACILDVQRV